MGVGSFGSNTVTILAMQNNQLLMRRTRATGSGNITPFTRAGSSGEASDDKTPQPLTMEVPKREYPINKKRIAIEILILSAFALLVIGVAR